MVRKWQWGIRIFSHSLPCTVTKMTQFFRSTISHFPASSSYSINFSLIERIMQNHTQTIGGRVCPFGCALVIRWILLSHQKRIRNTGWASFHFSYTHSCTWHLPKCCSLTCFARLRMVWCRLSSSSSSTHDHVHRAHSRTFMMWQSTSMWLPEGLI